jgi:hypothetical protein
MATTLRRVGTAALALLLAPAALDAQTSARTDVVTLRNGDRITGEVMRLERGRLEFKTDDAGTLYVEWDKVRSVEAARQFEVGTSDGLRFLGSLAPSDPGVLAVDGPAGPVRLRMAKVTLITAIGTSFWRRLDGSVDVGFSYTRSSDVAQLNVNSETIFRRARSDGRLGLSLTMTRQRDSAARDDRASLDGSYVRYLGPPWFVATLVRFETNEGLGIRLRSQAGVAVGPRMVNTNRAQVIFGGGVALNDERAVDAPGAQNVEAVLAFRGSYFTYDRPRTNLDLSVQYYPSLSNAGRQRLQLDGSARRELFKDFFVAVTVFDSFDSRPPNPAFDSNDVGVVASIGWSY